MLNRLIKLNAKRALGNSWSKAIAQVILLNGTDLLFILTAVFAYSIFTYPMLPDGLESITPGALICLSAILLIYSLVISPLKIGIKMWFFSLTGGMGEEDIALTFETFSSFKKVVKSFLLCLSLAIRKLFIYSLFSFVPIFLTAYSIKYMETAQTVRENFLSICCTVSGFCLLILAVVSAYYFCLRYFVVPYAFIEGNCKDVKSSFKISKQATKNYKGSLFFLNISLIFHYLLNNFVITALYTYPYTQSVKALYSRYLLENHKKIQSEENENKCSDKTQDSEQTNASQPNKQQ